MGWLTAPTRRSGWLVVELQPQNASYVHGRAEAKRKAQVSLFGQRPLDDATGAERLAKELRFSRYSCATLLRPGEYQLVQVEAPSVPPAELKAALRWRLKDMLDYPADEATLDVLQLPPEAEPAGRAANLYAVAAHSGLVRTCIERFERARIPLSVIDIPETAQRNIGALYEEEGRGLAVLHASEDACLLTVNFRAELLLARRIEFGTRQFSGSESERKEAFERVALEVQRTFDLVDRQYPRVTVSKLMIAPLPQESGFAPYLEQNLGMRVERIDLAQALAFNGGGAPDEGTQWRLFHLFGASLRH
jgi:MSHA biogenesis protein MshI